MFCSQGRITCYKEPVSLIFVNWLILRHNAIICCVGGRFHWLQQGTRNLSSDVMENKDKSKQNEHDSGMFQVKEIPKTNINDGINLVLPISINGRKIDGIVDTGAQIEAVSEDCFKNLELPVGCARFFR